MNGRDCLHHCTNWPTHTTSQEMLQEMHQGPKTFELPQRPSDQVLLKYFTHPHAQCERPTWSRVGGVPHGLLPAPWEGMFRKQRASKRSCRILSVKSSPSPCEEEATERDCWRPSYKWSVARESVLAFRSFEHLNGNRKSHTEIVMGWAQIVFDA